MVRESSQEPEQLRAIAAIVSRNVFLLINGIIFAVVLLLTLFGDLQEGISLGLITVASIVIGSTQEITAWRALQKLQLLAAPKATLLDGEGKESVIGVEEIKAGDSIKLQIGDQVPCDGHLTSSHGFEVSEALITGEAASSLRKPGDVVLAGSVVTAGSGIEEVEKAFAESRIALMTKSIKRYALVQSPIQASISRVIRFIGYLLLGIILFVAVRGYIVHESTVNIIQNIGALTSILLPQGIVVIITVFFSYGAVYLYRRHVLLQEVNATEKIGRIKNLCMDKTGTLTDTRFVADQLSIAPGAADASVRASIAAYIHGVGDSSETIRAIQTLCPQLYAGTVVEDLSFSSSRQYGAVRVRDDSGERVILAGAPDIFVPHFTKAEDREWVERAIETDARIGKRLICFAESEGLSLPADVSQARLSALALVTLTNELREGARDTITFFQERGVTVRIVSGDNAGTVQAVAAAAGVADAERVITGAELEAWSDADYLAKTRTYTIFARVKPEQKEKIIGALQEDGFTAMVGDGANDALAIKKSDLGLAMFAGAPATRQIASIVLVTNSFVDLPAGVRLADSVIQNISICAALFFNLTFLGLFFFVSLSAFGYAFPLTPLNVTFISYFTIVLPTVLIFYWVARPSSVHIPLSGGSFLRRVVPFALVSAILQTLVIGYAFAGSLEYRETHGPTSLVVLAFIVVGVLFFMHTPSVYGGSTVATKRKQFIVLALVEALAVTTLMLVPVVAFFYNLKAPPLRIALELVPALLVYALAQYLITRRFALAKSTKIKELTTAPSS